MTEIDILYLVNRLESLLNEARRIPFTSNVIINENKYLDIIDQMRVAIPEEVKQARRIQQDRERIMTQAREEAGRIISLAQEQASRLLDEHELLKAAEARSEAIIEQGRNEAEALRIGADDYTIEVLTQLENHLTTLLTTVKNGLATLGRGREEG